MPRKQKTVVIVEKQRTSGMTQPRCRHDLTVSRARIGDGEEHARIGMTRGQRGGDVRGRRF